MSKRLQDDSLRDIEIEQALKLMKLVEERIKNLEDQIKVAYMEDICDIDDYGMKFKKDELKSLLEEAKK